MTADTSAVVAALSTWHERHAQAAQALHGVRSLPAHARLEAYSTLTRMPGGLSVPSQVAVATLAAHFAGPVLRLDGRAQASLIERLSDAGVSGGAAYDGLIGLEAQAAKQTLLTLDRRAAETYHRLGVDFRLIGS